jgi:DNA-binding transcriptional LysR family regulator
VFVRNVYCGRVSRVPALTFSRMISDLQAFLGTRRLIRTTCQFTPTYAAKAYVAAARPTFEQVEDSERLAGGELEAPKGELVIAAPTRPPIPETQTWLLRRAICL